MNYRAEYNGVHVAWENKPVITPVIKQILSDYKVAFELAARPNTDDLMLHRLLTFAEDDAGGHCGLYCYVFKEKAATELVKYIKPFRIVTVQHNGGFIQIRIDMIYRDKNDREYKPVLMFFRQDDIAWLRSLISKYNLEYVEYAYLTFLGKEKQRSLLYEQADKDLIERNNSQPVSVTWAINSGELICAILNNDDAQRISNSNALDELTATDGEEKDSMIEMLAEITKQVEGQING